MEAAKKGKKTSKPKKGSKPKKKNKKNNSMNFFSKFMLTILLLAVLVASCFVLLKATSQRDNESTRQRVNETTRQRDNESTRQRVNESTSQRGGESESKKASLKETFKEQQNISGNWLSTEQGASLTIDNYGYRIDFFGVDASAPMTGMIIIKDNSINFISDGRDCKNEEGSYKVTFDKKNIRLVCKKDDCSKRRNILEANWEWMDI